MFDEVTRKPDGRRRVRRGAFVVLSAALQVSLVLALVVIGDRFRAKITDTEPIVEVKFFKAPPAPAAPPAPPAPPPAPRRSPPVRARKEPISKPPPSALVQPKAPPPLEEEPSPSEPPERDQGVEGGVVGGAPAASSDAGAQPGGVEEAPTFPKPGYRLPHLAEPTCVANSLDLSKELQRSVSGAIAVKFAILAEGRPAHFQILTHVPDNRIGEAIWHAVQSCRWVPGADAQGKPVSIWVILPIRFTVG